MTVLSAIAFTLPLLHALGILSALEALYVSRSSQGAIAWCLFLVIFPYAGLPVYWIFGRAKFRGYAERFARVAQQQEDGLAWYRSRIASHAKDPASIGVQDVSTFTSISDRSFLGGNQAQVLIDGAETFGEMFKAIDQASSFVLVEFFIIKDDAIGKSFQECLIRAANRGVRVLVLYDEVGSHKLPRGYCEKLTDSGVQISEFGSRRGLINFFQINFRNHRKIVVVDGQHAFLGGLNVGDEYLGRDPRFGRWRDTHIKLSGPAALEAQALFVRDWVWATGAVPSIEAIAPTAAGDLPVLILGSGPADRRDRCLLFFLHCIASAQKRIWIASPYFVPDDALLSALQLAALRGVDVRILLPAQRDHTLVWLASFFFVPAVTVHGVRAFRYEQGFMHQKVVLVDDAISAVGTANFDNRSFRLNFEVMSVIADTRVAAEVASMLEDDFASSREVTAEQFGDYPLWKRLGAKFARLFAPVL